MRVIVIGAGIAGLSAAIALRKVGIDVTIYERSMALGEVGAGIGLWANACRALDYLGAGDTVREHSLRMRRSEMRSQQGHTVVMTLDGAALEQRFGLTELVRVAHRVDLIEALASHVPLASIRFLRECIAVESLESRPRVRFSDGEVDDADVVIGADGIRSAVRNALLPPEPPRYAGYTCWRGVCPRPPEIEAGYMSEWWGRGKRLGLVSLTGDRLYWFAVENAPANQRVADDRAHLLKAFAGWAEPARRVFETTTDAAILHNDIIDRPPQQIWAKGRVGLIGDAAHPTTPNLGQGGCLAIEDAVVLARHLASSSDPALALQAFTAERSRRTAAIVNESWTAGRMAQAKGRFACAARDFAIGAISNVASPSLLVRHALFDVGPLTRQNGAEPRAGSGV